MEKLIISFTVASVTSVAICLFLISCGVKIFNSICVGLIISNTILFAIFTPDLLNNTNTDETFYVISYICICLAVYVIWIIYLCLDSRTDRCICPCCRKYEYFPIE